MVNSKQYTVNDRQYTTFKSLEQELQTSSKPNYLFDLPYLGLMDVQGEKANEFLQGQLTCDLNLLSPKTLLQGAQCNLKGRILSLPAIIECQGTKLILPVDLHENTLMSLSKTAMLSKVKLSTNKHVRVLGFYLQNSDAELPIGTNASHFELAPYEVYSNEELCVCSLGNGYFYLIVSHRLGEVLIKQFQNNDLLLGSLTWHTKRLINKDFEIYQASRGLFLPHRLGLHLGRYISFNKGCYKGQEIIARTQYRAAIKHELNIFHISTSSTLNPGQLVYVENGMKEYGELIDFSPIGENNYLIAISALKEEYSLVRLQGCDTDVDLETIPSHLLDSIALNT